MRIANINSHKMGNDMSSSGLDRRGPNDDIVTAFNHFEGGGVSDVFMRGGITFTSSRNILCNLGVAPQYASLVAALLTALEVVPDVINLMRKTWRRLEGIPQHALVEGIPEGEKYPAIFNMKIHRRSHFTFKHSDERYTFVGIACVPVSTEIQSPEAEVVEGGINHSYVHIHLKPEKEYEYGCHIIITGKPREQHRPQSTTEPKDEILSSVVPKVDVSLPPFWPDCPASWFAKAEAQFELAGITCQQTKYNYVVSQLNQQVAAEVEDIITSPPKPESYDRLKAELIRRLSPSRTQRMTQLLSQEEMGGWKPSQTYSRSQSKDPYHSHSRDHRRSTPKKSPIPHDVCWYHLNFGDKARKCTPPCSHQHRDSHQQENIIRR